MYFSSSQVLPVHFKMLECALFYCCYVLHSTYCCFTYVYQHYILRVSTNIVVYIVSIVYCIILLNCLPSASTVILLFLTSINLLKSGLFFLTYIKTSFLLANHFPLEVMLCRDVSIVPSWTAFVMSQLVSTRNSEFIETFRDKVLHFSMLIFTESKIVLLISRRSCNFFLNYRF